VNEALRLRPDLAEVHLAAARHLFLCYRDFERARLQITIAAKGLSNNTDLLELMASIDRMQGRWDKATIGMERATTLDPRNPDLLEDLRYNYECLRRYRDSGRIVDRMIELRPEDRMMPVWKALLAFEEKADLKGARAFFEALPSSLKADPQVTFFRVLLASSARDFVAADEILSESSNEEFPYGSAARIPRRIVVLWLELWRGNHPTVEEFGAAREKLYQKVEADPADPWLLTALAATDVALGRKDEAIKEGRRAVEMVPISENAVQGPWIARNLAGVYAWARQPDLAFEQLNILAKIPTDALTYGDLKTHPDWDPVRKDPRFEKLLAELAPRD
jgi:serine/threonine-protein kinase